MSDYEALLKDLFPKDYSEELDPEERGQFQQIYGDKPDEELSFLAANKALPFQHGVESFEKPSVFTRIRRGLGIYTGDETALMKKQDKLIETKLAPIQKARTQIASHLALALAAAPQTDQQTPGPVAAALGFNQPQTMMAAGPAAAPSPLQAAPNLQPAFGSDQPPTMIRPAPSAGDQALAGMPLGTPGQMGALSVAQPFAGPPQAGQDPIPFGPLETTGYQAVPVYNPMTGGYDPSLELSPIRSGPPMISETVHDQPMVMADRKVVPPPAPAPAPRNLSIPERLQVAKMMEAQATGHLMPDETGKLVPASFMAPDARSLNDEQQAALSSIYRGGESTPGVRLPAAPFMAALKGKQEGKNSDISQPVREWLVAEGLPQTPENVKTGAEVVRQRKNEDEQEAIKIKELLQTGPQDVRIQLAKRGKNVITAAPEDIQQAIADAADQELSVAARKKMQDFQLSPIGEEQQAKLLGLQQILRVTHRLKTEFSEAERRKFVGYFNQPVERVKQLIQADPRFAKFDALVNREGIAAFETGGKALTAQEAKIIFGFLPQGGEMSPENFEAKLLEADDYGRTKIHDIVKIATSNRQDIGKAMEGSMPNKEKKQPVEKRFAELEKQGMKEKDIYNQLVVEGYK